jgi:hypothetical protein
VCRLKTCFFDNALQFSLAVTGKALGDKKGGNGKFSDGTQKPSACLKQGG